jgi:hypothetical protein
MKVLSQVVGGWQVDAVLRYQSGALIQSPPSSNQLTAQLERHTGDFLSTTQTFWNRNSGVNPLAVDPNCGCFNPQTVQALNKSAWTDAAPGQFGVSAPFYNDYRWQRQPSEAMSFGRNFRMGKEGRYNLQVRAEFQNISNRLFLSAPSVGTANVANPNTPITLTNGVNTAYGYINTTNGAGAVPRSGQVVARFTF